MSQQFCIVIKPADGVREISQRCSWVQELDNLPFRESLVARATRKQRDLAPIRAEAGNLEGRRNDRSQI
jgi:hypothetical protein